MLGNVFIPATKEKWYRYSGKQLKISYKTIYSIIIWPRNYNLGHLCQRNENVGSLTNPFQFSSVTQKCPTLRPQELQYGSLPVHHQLPESTQTHVHQVGDAIHPSHPLSSPSPPAPNLSHHQGLFQWVNSLHKVAKVLEFQLEHQSFQWTPQTDLL